MIRSLSKALHAVTVTADGARRRVACVGVRALVTAMLAAMLAAAPPLHAQRPPLEVGLSYGGIVSGSSQEYAGLSSNVWLWSRGSFALTGEASASLRTHRVGIVCPSVPGFGCDQGTIGDVARLGLTSRVGKRDGSGAYGLAAVGWWGAMPLDVWRDNRVLERAWSERMGGLALGLGAGVSLPFGDRRSGIEARWTRLAGNPRAGDWLQVSLTRRW